MDRWADVIARLHADGFTSLDNGPVDPVRILHRPSPRRGFFGAEPMHTVALVDLYYDSATRFLELALETAHAVDVMITGRTTGQSIEHPTLQSLSSMISVGKKDKRPAPHRILVIMDSHEAPSWINAVLPGTSYDQPRRSLITAIYARDTQQLHLPAPKHQRQQSIIDMATALFTPGDAAADSPPPDVSR